MGKHAEDNVVESEWAEEDQYSPDQALAGLIVMSCLCWMLMMRCCRRFLLGQALHITRAPLQCMH
jgi:hypothetical protein